MCVVDRADPRAQPEQQLRDHDQRGDSRDVAGVALVGEAQHEDLRARSPRPPRLSPPEPAHDVVGHVVVDVVGQLDEPEAAPSLRRTCQDR